MSRRATIYSSIERWREDRAWRAARAFRERELEEALAGPAWYRRAVLGGLPGATAPDPIDMARQREVES